MGTMHEPPASGSAEGLAGALTAIGNGAAVRAGSRLLITACTFLTTVLVVRAVGAERYGALAFGLSIVGLIAGLFAGLGTASTRSIASAVATGDRPEPLVHALAAVVVLVTGLGAVAIAVSIALSQRQLRSGDVWILIVAMSLLLLGRVTAAAGSSVARGLGRVGLMELSPTTEVVTKLLLVVTVLLLGARQGLVPLAAVYAGAGVAAAAAGAWVIRHSVGRWTVMAPAARAGLDLVRLTAPFVVGAVAYRLIHGFDVAVLGVVRPGAVVGAYASTLALVEGLVMLVPGLLSAMFVTAATGLYEAPDRRGFADLYLAVSKLSVVLTMPAFILLAIVPTEALSVVYGSRFPGSSPVVRTLLAGYFVTVALGFNGQALVASGAWSTLGKALVWPAVTMVVSALVSIPIWGGIGAALATTVSFFVLNASLSIALYAKTGVHPIRRDRILVLASSPIAIAAAAVLSSLIGGGFWSAAACASVGWVVWLGLLFAIGGLRIEEVRAMRPRRRIPARVAEHR